MTLKNWQKNRNYRRIKDGSGNIIANIITVDGVDVKVTDEAFLAYSQADRRERYITEELDPSKILSLDKLPEDEIPLGELGIEQEPSAETIALNRESRREMAKQKEQLAIMLSDLDKKEKQLIQALFFDRIPIREYARQMGVQLRTIQYRRDKLLEKMRRRFFS